MPGPACDAILDSFDMPLRGGYVQRFAAASCGELALVTASRGLPKVASFQVALVHVVGPVLCEVIC